MLETESPIETIAKHRELICDKKVLQKAISKWQKMRGVENHSKRDTERYANIFQLPADVLLTIKDFRISCG